MRYTWYTKRAGSNQWCSKKQSEFFESIRISYYFFFACLKLVDRVQKLYVA